MALAERLDLYRALEGERRRPRVVYVTSPRQNANGVIASDAVAELLVQLKRLSNDQDALDLLILSNGGDRRSHEESCR